MTLSETLAAEVHTLNRKRRNLVRRNIRLRRRIRVLERERDNYRNLAILGAVQEGRRRGMG